MTATVLPAPRRIGTLRYATAALAVRLGLEPRSAGADVGWADVLRAGVPATVLDGRPALAIAAAAHREVHDPYLGVLYVAGMEPARIYDDLAGGVR